MIINQSDLTAYAKQQAKYERRHSAHFAIGAWLGIMAVSSIGAGLCKIFSLMGV